MTRNLFRLACHQCDRDDFDGVDKLPKKWADITKVQSLQDSRRQVDDGDKIRSPLDWYTHVGTCPDCQQEEQEHVRQE